MRIGAKFRRGGSELLIWRQVSCAGASNNRRMRASKRCQARSRRLQRRRYSCSSCRISSSAGSAGAGAGLNPKGGRGYSCSSCQFSSSAGSAGTGAGLNPKGTRLDRGRRALRLQHRCDGLLRGLLRRVVHEGKAVGRPTLHHGARKGLHLNGQLADLQAVALLDGREIFRARRRPCTTRSCRAS